MSRNDKILGFFRPKSDTLLMWGKDSMQSKKKTQQKQIIKNYFLCFYTPNNNFSPPSIIGIFPRSWWFSEINLFISFFLASTILPINHCDGAFSFNIYTAINHSIKQKAKQSCPIFPVLNEIWNKKPLSYYPVEIRRVRAWLFYKMFNWLHALCLHLIDFRE